MHQTHHQQTNPAGCIQRGKGHTACYAHIRHQHHHCRHKLQKGAVDSIHPFNKFIQQNHCGVQARRPKAKGNAQQVVASGSHVTNACNQHNPQSGHCKANPAFGGHFLFEQNGTGHRHNHRRKIIAEGCHRDGCILVCLKQQNPVESHRHTGKQQKRQFPLDCTKWNFLPCCQEKNQQHNYRQHCSIQCQFSGRYGDMADK